MDKIHSYYFLPFLASHPWILCYNLAEVTIYLLINGNVCCYLFNESEVLLRYLSPHCSALDLSRRLSSHKRACFSLEGSGNTITLCPGTGLCSVTFLVNCKVFKFRFATTFPILFISAICHYKRLTPNKTVITKIYLRAPFMYVDTLSSI